MGNKLLLNSSKINPKINAATLFILCTLKRCSSAQVMFFLKSLAFND